MPGHSGELDGRELGALSSWSQGYSAAPTVDVGLMVLLAEIRVARSVLLKAVLF